MNKLFESRPFLIEFIRRCDQATLRVLLKPICKQLTHPDVVKEIARNLKLTGIESVKCYKQIPKWTYGEFLKFDEEGAKKLESMLGNSIINFQCSITEIEIVQCVLDKGVETLNRPPTDWCLVKVTRKNENKQKMYGFVSSIKDFNGNEQIHELKTNIVWNRKECSSIEEYLVKNWGFAFELCLMVNIFDLNTISDDIIVYMSEGNSLYKQYCDKQSFYQTSYHVFMCEKNEWYPLVLYPPI